MNKILIIIEVTNFKNKQGLSKIKELLERAGHQVFLASFKNSEGEIKIDVNFEKINTNDYNALILIGDEECRVHLDNRKVVDLVKEMRKDKKVIAAIGLAPVILVKSGILKDKQAVVAEEGLEILKKENIQYNGPGVARDSDIITASGSEYIPIFVDRINESLMRR